MQSIAQNNTDSDANTTTLATKTIDFNATSVQNAVPNITSSVSSVKIDNSRPTETTVVTTTAKSTTMTAASIAATNDSKTYKVMSPVNWVTNATTVKPTSPAMIGNQSGDYREISDWIPFIFVLSLMLFCLVGIDPQQDLHLESLDMN